ncbi:MAG TPA: MMPL family transporter [Candidatus Scatomorpha pullicola]|nr:MMPL family transporter [Candidatus Scatomorpha pullicola]
MDGLTRGITRHKKLVIAIFLVATVISAVLILGVSVNYDLTDYLPEDSESTIALDLMYEEFGSGVPNTRVMVRNLTLTGAVETKVKIAQAPGVTGVMWLDDTQDMSTPIELMDSATVEQYWHDGTALYQVTIEEGRESEAVAALYEMLGSDVAISGNSANTASMQNLVVSEVVGAASILIPIIIIILLLTTTSWISPVLFLLTIGVAVLINMGTNVVFGEISFVTQSVSPILQLAVSLDYAIFLLNSFGRHRQEVDSSETAMRLAIKESFSSIAASAATTLFGFMALMFMRFGIGSDLGLNLMKGIVLSYVSVMVFLPALALASVKLLDKTSHRPIIHTGKRLGRALVKVRIPALILVLIAVIPCYLAQTRADFLYGNGAPDTRTDYGRDTVAINEEFGESNALVLLVPRGDPGAEAKMAEELAGIDHVTSVLSYAGTVGAVPEGFLDESIVSQFYSDGYARIIMYTDTSEEGDEAFAVVEQVRATADKYYSESWLCGQSANLYDMRDVVTADSTLVNWIAIGFIFLTLLVTFKSATLPFILLFVIEAAIWINLSVPYFADQPLVYIGYLVINTVQLGATIDYAILMTNGYTANRRTMGKREAVVATLNTNFESVLTSGVILTAAGLCLGFVSSLQVVAELGILLARGTVLSMAMVVLALPALLMLFDPLTARLTWKAGFIDTAKKEAETK